MKNDCDDIRAMYTSTYNSRCGSSLIRTLTLLYYDDFLAPKLIRAPDRRSIVTRICNVLFTYII